MLNLRVGENDDGRAEASQKSLMVIDVRADAHGRIWGALECGDRGRASNIRRQDGTVAHPKTADEADMPPFCFLFAMREGFHTGVAIFQRAGLLGFKSVLCSDLKDRFAGMDITMKIGALVDATLLDSYFHQGMVTELEAVYHIKPNDNREFMRRSTIDNSHIQNSTTKLKIGIQVTQSMGERLARKYRTLVKQDNPRALVSLDGLGEPNDVVVEVDPGNGKVKRFRVARASKNPVARDITGEVPYDRDTGHARQSAVEKISKEWASELLDTLEAAG